MCLAFETHMRQLTDTLSPPQLMEMPEKYTARFYPVTAMMMRILTVLLMS